MRILYVVPYVPNPIRVRPYHFIASLLGAGHEVTVATLWTNDAERADLAKLEAVGARVLAEQMPASASLRNSLLALPSRAPLQAVYSWQPALFARLAQAAGAGAFDVVHVEHLRGSRYGLELQRVLAQAGAPAATTPVVWDSVDCISYLFAQASRNSRSLKGKLMTTLELGRTQRYEATLVSSFDRTLVTSPVDKAALVDLFARFGREPACDPASRIEVIPNGVDLEEFHFSPLPARNPLRIVFSGKMSYHANVTAALYLVKEIMPLVWAIRPDAEVWIVGKDPPGDITALATGGAGDTAPQPRRVVVTGAVPDLHTYIEQAAVAAAPLLYGAGIQNKVLEAMSCGTPVVATPQASVALSAQPGRDLLVAAEPPAFAAALLDLLASPQRREAVGRAGRAYVEANHTWPGAAARLGEIYTACREHRHTGRN